VATATFWCTLHHEDKSAWAEAEFMNNFVEFSGHNLENSQTLLYLPTSFKPLLLMGVVVVGVLVPPVNSKEENL
jgi:hypothetical protein